MSAFTQSYTKEEVKYIQRALNEVCYGVVPGFKPLVADGVFGNLSITMLRQAQEHQGYPVTGVYDGPFKEYCDSIIDTKYIKDGQIRELAIQYDIEYEMLKAFTKVESKEAGFLPSGRPVILFERHKFYQALKVKLAKDKLNYYAITYPGIVNMNAGGYSGNEAEWNRLEQAMRIDPEAAMESASWGLGQIMGFNAKLIGYTNVFYMTSEFTKSEEKQVEGMIKFCRVNPSLYKALKEKDFPNIAKYYNGTNYKINSYDLRLRDAYIAFGGKLE